MITSYDFDNNVIINKYKLALFEKYYTYLEIIDELNYTIPSIARDLNVDHNIVKDLDYPIFCKCFMEKLKDKVYHSKVLIKNDLNVIFIEIVEDRILEARDGY